VQRGLRPPPGDWHSAPLNTMKPFIPAAAASLALLALLGCQTGSTTSPGSESSSAYTRMQGEMTVLLETWHRAIVDRDVDTLDKLWADDYQSVNPSGQIVPKAEDLRLIATQDLVFERLVVQDVQIPYRSRSLVVTVSVTSARGVYRGQSFGGQFRNTTVFEKRLGQWKAVWGQSTEIPPAAIVE